MIVVATISMTPQADRQPDMVPRIYLYMHDSYIILLLQPKTE